MITREIYDGHGCIIFADEYHEGKSALQAIQDAQGITTCGGGGVVRFSKPGKEAFIVFPRREGQSYPKWVAEMGVTDE